MTTMTQVPPRALVVGGGAVGVEFATMVTGLADLSPIWAQPGLRVTNSDPSKQPTLMSSRFEQISRDSAGRGRIVT